MTNSHGDELPPAQTEMLASRAHGGDREAFGRLFERVAPAVFTYASLRLGRRWQDAEDAVAEVWLRAYAALPAYDPERPFRPWIFGFARNVVPELQRKITGQGRVSPEESVLARLPDDASTITRRASRNEQLRQFADWAKEALSDYEQEVLILRGLLGRPLAHVATALGRSEHAVTVCWARILEKTRSRALPSGLWNQEEAPA